MFLWIGHLSTECIMDPQNKSLREHHTVCGHFLLLFSLLSLSLDKSPSWWFRNILSYVLLASGSNPAAWLHLPACNILAKQSGRNMPISHSKAHNRIVWRRKREESVHKTLAQFLVKWLYEHMTTKKFYQTFVSYGSWFGHIGRCRCRSSLPTVQKRNRKGQDKKRKEPSQR